MSEHDSGRVEAIRGVIEGVIGKAKEIIGIVISHDGLRKEGRAQQDKAQAQRDVAKKEAQAEASRAAESTAKARQKAPKRAKDTRWTHGCSCFPIWFSAFGTAIKPTWTAAGVRGVRAGCSRCMRCGIGHGAAGGARHDRRTSLAHRAVLIPSG
jgi:uncharacterized protein YjbJ (UPF0337 family)